MTKILIVDDEELIRETLSEILKDEGYETVVAQDGEEAIAYIQKNKYDVLLCDIKMPKKDGIEVLMASLDKYPEVPVILISGHATVDIAVDAVRKGAYDFISKPPDLNRLLITLRNAVDKTALVKETKTLKKRINKVKDILGASEAIVRIKEDIDKVASKDTRVLITGGNGTGKELVARWIHEKSNRASAPLIEVNCAAIPSELIESELFGHEKGSFTSAIKQRLGKFELANGGTLFLDEVGDMSLSAQAKVLRVLQEKKVSRVGGDKDFDVNVRIIAATNKNLKDEILKGNFREDLYHRLAVILIHVPSLNERLEDIPILCEAFLEEVIEEYGMVPKKFSDKAIKELQKIDWTGNIRELRNVVERLAILSDNTITEVDVINYAKPGTSSSVIPFPVDSFINLDEALKWAEARFRELRK
jgi:DNA-binding NtrC family response regulator